jgi:hypothetical protein
VGIGLIAGERLVAVYRPPYRFLARQGRLDYIELPQRLGGIVPFRTETVRRVWVWDG